MKPSIWSDERPEQRLRLSALHPRPPGCLAMTEAYCDCTGRPPWPSMLRLHGGGPNRYYLCRACGAVREDIYRDGAIVARRWHDAPNARLPAAIRAEARAILSMPHPDQLELWPD